MIECFFYCDKEDYKMIMRTGILKAKPIQESKNLEAFKFVAKSDKALFGWKKDIELPKDYIAKEIFEDTVLDGRIKLQLCIPDIHATCVSNEYIKNINNIINSNGGLPNTEVLNSVVDSSYDKCRVVIEFIKREWVVADYVVKKMQVTSRNKETDEF